MVDWALKINYLSICSGHSSENNYRRDLCKVTNRIAECDHCFFFFFFLNPVVTYATTFQSCALQLAIEAWCEWSRWNMSCVGGRWLPLYLLLTLCLCNILLFFQFCAVSPHHSVRAAAEGLPLQTATHLEGGAGRHPPLGAPSRLGGFAWSGSKLIIIIVIHKFSMVPYPLTICSKRLTNDWKYIKQTLPKRVIIYNYSKN